MMFENPLQNTFIKQSILNNFGFSKDSFEWTTFPLNEEIGVKTEINQVKPFKILNTSDSQQGQVKQSGTIWGIKKSNNIPCFQIKVHNLKRRSTQYLGLQANVRMYVSDEQNKSIQEVQLIGGESVKISLGSRGQNFLSSLKIGQSDVCLTKKFFVIAVFIYSTNYQFSKDGSFQAIADMIVSPPIMVKSREKIQETLQSNRFLYDLFMPIHLQRKGACCSLSMQFKKQEIANNEKSLKAYLYTPNLSFKVIHPYYLGYKFNNVLEIYHQDLDFSQIELADNPYKNESTLTLLKIQKIIVQKLFQSNQDGKKDLKTTENQPVLILGIQNDSQIPISHPIYKSILQKLSYLDGDIIQVYDKQLPVTIDGYQKLNMANLDENYAEIFHELSLLKISQDFENNEWKTIKQLKCDQTLSESKDIESTDVQSYQFYRTEFLLASSSDNSQLERIPVQLNNQILEKGFKNK